MLGGSANSASTSKARIQQVNAAKPRKPRLSHGSRSWPRGRKVQVCADGALRVTRKAPSPPLHGPSEDPGSAPSEEARAAGPQFPPHVNSTSTPRHRNTHPQLPLFPVTAEVTGHRSDFIGESAKSKGDPSFSNSKKQSIYPETSPKWTIGFLAVR